MQALSRRSAGLDVHRLRNGLTVRIAGNDGRIDKHQRSFGGFTHDLEALGTWRKDLKGPLVVMDRTGLSWQSGHGSRDPGSDDQALVVSKNAPRWMRALKQYGSWPTPALAQSPIPAPAHCAERPMLANTAPQAGGSYLPRARDASTVTLAVSGGKQAPACFPSAPLSMPRRQSPQQNRQGIQSHHTL